MVEFSLWDIFRNLLLAGRWTIGLSLIASHRMSRDQPIPYGVFLALGVVYFSMAYLLLGAVFLAIGSLAATVREVQTLQPARHQAVNAVIEPQPG